MPFGGPNSERALILAPRGRDAEVASKLFRDAGWPTLICTDVARLCEELGKGAAFGIVVEEALRAGSFPQSECRSGFCTYYARISDERCQAWFLD